MTLLAQTPKRCEACHGSDFHLEVCRACGWRAPCPTCARKVSGRASKKFCDQRCHDRYHNRERLAVSQLAQLAEEEFRRIIARACLHRWPGGGRLKLRFGRYDPKK